MNFRRSIEALLLYFIRTFPYPVCSLLCLCNLRPYDDLPFPTFYYENSKHMAKLKEFYWGHPNTHHLGFTS